MGGVPDLVVPALLATTATFFEAYGRPRTPTPHAAAFWEERIVGPETHAAFLDANGGPRTLLSIARRTT